jgi:tetratricopeptide (TPR) repeat protein
MMFYATAMVVASLALGAPAPGKGKNEWVGQIVCTKTGSPLTYELKDGKFELKPFNMRYIDMRVVEEKDDHVCLQHDNEVIWVRKVDALRPKDAIKHFSEVLDSDGSDQRAISARCWAYMAIRDYDRALKDADTAVQLSPNSVAWKNNRGEVYVKRKDYKKAIEEFTSILEDTPEYYFALHNRSEAYIGMKKFKEALTDIEAALKNERNVPYLHANKARVLATAPDAKLRDGKKALASAQEAMKLSKFSDGRIMDAMAAAYAELGEFDKAVEYQQKAIDDAEFMIDDGTSARKRMTLYRDKKPFRDE